MGHGIDRAGLGLDKPGLQADRPGHGEDSRGHPLTARKKPSRRQCLLFRARFPPGGTGGGIHLRQPELREVKGRARAVHFTLDFPQSKAATLARHLRLRHMLPVFPARQQFPILFPEPGKRIVAVKAIHFVPVIQLGIFFPVLRIPEEKAFFLRQ